MFHEAQRGSAHGRVRWVRKNQVVVCSPLRLQSAQSLLSGCFMSSRRIFALRSVVALSGLYIVLNVVDLDLVVVVGECTVGCVTIYLLRLYTFALLLSRHPRRQPCPRQQPALKPAEKPFSVAVGTVSPN